jgi:hypothetical protein
MPSVPVGDVVAWIAVMNQTFKPCQAAKGNSPEEVDKIDRQWCNSMQRQTAVWVGP